MLLSRQGDVTISVLRILFGDVGAATQYCHLFCHLETCGFVCETQTCSVVPLLIACVVVLQWCICCSKDVFKNSPAVLD